MKYTETTPGYNERRYGKPWMAITTSESLTKDFRFIDWDGRPGCTGEFNFETEPGTILAYGQKDIRKGRGGVDGYQLAMPDGTLPGLSDSEAQALRKLPMGARAAECARLNIAEAGGEIVQCQEQLAKCADAYRVAYENRIEKANAKIARFRAFLPVEADAEDFLSGAA